VDLIENASDLAEAALAEVVAGLKAGISEAEVAAELEYQFKKRGASEPSFHTIILFGERSSLPHGEPSNARLKPGDIVLIDMGCRYAGYCSDLTRTFVYDRMPAAWFTDIYQVTAAAQKAALAALHPGMPAHEVDAVARKIIADAGFGDNFGHGLGHGVGIEIHERPRLNSESDIVLREGMVVTIEPGIYLPNRGGVRIEDMAVLTGTGHRLISKYTRELKVLQ
jgi:Xaa-Pro aminopeptidase